MIELSKKELHGIYYSRMGMLHEFLKSRGIEYYAIGGTLLGAIRDKGFIPWDTDMDIAMTRKNYNLFLQQCSQLDPKYFCVVNYKLTKYVEHPLTKVCLKGVLNKQERLSKKFDDHFHIDVFPIDAVYKNFKKQNRIIRKVKCYRKILFIKSRALNNKNLFKRFLLFLLKFLFIPFSTHFICKKYDKIVSSPARSKYLLDDSLWTSGGVYVFSKETHKISTYGKPQLHTFGPIQILVPENYHQFLVDTYGNDYMTPLNRNPDGEFKCFLSNDFIW